MAIVSEILRFILPRSTVHSTAFAQLRVKVKFEGHVKTQYFGYVLPDEGMPPPMIEDQMCWYIEWPEKTTYRASDEFKSGIARIANGTPRSLLLHFTETKEGETLRGLGSGVSQFVSSQGREPYQPT